MTDRIIAQIKANPDAPQIPKEAVDAAKVLIQTCGQADLPITVDTDGTIVDGYAVLEAARQLHLQTVTVATIAQGDN